MRCLMATITYRDQAMRMFFPETLWIFDVVYLRCEVAAELTKARRAGKCEVALIAPFRGFKVAAVFVAARHCYSHASYAFRGDLRATGPACGGRRRRLKNRPERQRLAVRGLARGLVQTDLFGG